MRHAACIVLAAFLAAACPTPVRAAGVCLAWTECYGDGGLQLRTFACNTNAGSHRLVASYVAPAGIVHLSGNEVTIDFDAGSTYLPLWWQFQNTGVCRQAALGMNLAPNPSWVTCQDYWSGQAVGGIGSYAIGFEAANRARLRIAVAVPPAAAGPLTEGLEYFSANVVISNAKTVGTNSCPGCATPMCITLSSLKLTQPSGANTTLQQPAYTAGYPSGPRFSHMVFWQSLGGTNCFVVPVRATTWGAVKSLYR